MIWCTLVIDSSAVLCLSVPMVIGKQGHYSTILNYPVITNERFSIFRHFSYNFAGLL